MSISVSFELLSELSNFLVERTGLFFSKDRFSNFENLIKPAARDLGFNDIESCIKWVLSSKITGRQFRILIRHLTIGETYFFRDKKIFEVLEYQVLPELISHKRKTGQRLKIWSAACSTGEEAYSLAILLKRLIPDLKNWNLTILATDINHESLKKGAEGTYGNWSFRDAPTWLKQKYFTQYENQYEIMPDIKKMVNFSYLNLSENIYPSPVNKTNSVDLILCRNVLMYFNPDYIKKVIDRLYHSIADKGWLIVSPGETSNQLFKQFKSVNFNRAILYKKDLTDDIKPDDIKPAPVLSDKILLSRINEKNEEETSVFEKKDLAKEKIPEKISIENARDSYLKGNYSQALEKLLTLNSIYPQNLEVISLIAEIHANQGRSEHALDWCKKGLKIDKLNLNLCFLCAGICRETGNTEQAVKYLNKTLYINPDFVLAHFFLGIIFMNQGRTNDSNRYFKNSLSLLISFADEDIVPESKGITAGELKDTINRLKKKMVLNKTGKYKGIE
ncbi:CheR family methyltransferase [Desulfobacterales bacterium HSG17]|nr:CheR family methyltransferase [Desulfobacterales bacterium HSG17]